MEVTSVIMTGLNLERVLHSLLSLAGHELEQRRLRMVDDNTMNYVSEKVLRIIRSYSK